MPFVGLPNPILTGEELSGTDLATWYNELLALASPWTPYTPALTTGGTAATGQTMAGGYLQTGKAITGRALATFSSSVGTGNYFLSAPVACNEGIGESAGSALFLDTSAGNRYPLSVFWISNMVVSFGVPSGTPGARLSNVLPVTVAVGDQISWKFNFEGA